MVTHYTLRGKQRDQPIEREGTLTDEHLAGIENNQDSAKINIAIRELLKQDINAEWEECILRDISTQQEETYLRHKKRWTHSSKIHSRQ